MKRMDKIIEKFNIQICNLWCMEFTFHVWGTLYCVEAKYQV